mgnify:FL=1
MLFSTIFMLLFIIIFIFGGSVALVYISVKKASIAEEENDEFDLIENNNNK